MHAPLCTFDEIDALTNGMLGVHDVPCLWCGPNCHAATNRRRKVLRIWRDKPDFATYSCARCGAHGYARADGAKPVDPQRRARFKAETAKRHRQAQARGKANARRALNIWNEAQPGSGSIVESYLGSRGLTPAFAQVFRFHPLCPHPTGVTLPAMIASVERTGGRAAIHRTFLASDGGGKASIHPQRAGLGPVGGGAVRLAPIVPNTWLIVGEGIETTLSAMQATGLPGWAALSAGGIESLILPPEANMVLICADNDPSVRGQRAARVATQLWLVEGRRVRVAVPPGAGDFNDVLIGGQQSLLVRP